jgi:hypothetical protein
MIPTGKFSALAVQQVWGKGSSESILCSSDGTLDTVMRESTAQAFELLVAAVLLNVTNTFAW